MATSLGYALMNWTSEFARHAKSKREKRKNRKRKNDKEPVSSSDNNTKPVDKRVVIIEPSFEEKFSYLTTNDEPKIVGSESKPSESRLCVNCRLSKQTVGFKDNRAAEDEVARRRSIETSDCAVQTLDVICPRCEKYEEQVVHLSSQLSDVQMIQEELRHKLATTKTTLASSMERESSLRNVHESLELEEAQLRYELDEMKMNLIKQLDQRDSDHSEKVRQLEQMMKSKDAEWSKRNEELQRDLRNALTNALNDTEREEHSLSTLEREINSLRSVIELRSTENRELRATNNQLAERVEHQHWLEQELDKAKHRLEELAIIVQHKMVSERELLELSESLQQDLVQSRAETLHFRQELENRQYLLEHNNQNLINSKVKHSQSDLFANLAKSSDSNKKVFEENERRKQSLIISQQRINRKKEEVDLQNRRLAASSAAANGSNAPTEHRNQHQKASSGKPERPESLVFDVREKMESVAWMIQLPPTSASSSHTDKRRRI